MRESAVPHGDVPAGAGSTTRYGDLFAVQPWMTLEDYATAERFARKVEALMALVDAARARDAAGRALHPALVVFPENFSTFLAVAGHADLVRGAATIDGAIARVALARLPSLIGTMLRHRIASPKHAVLVMLSAVSWPIHHRTFRAAARGHDAWIVAGSLVTAANRHGAGNERFAALDRRCFNVSLAFAPDGRAVNETRKVNLVPTLEDELGLSAGRLAELAPFETALGRVGTMICYDGFHEPHTHHEPGFAPTGAHLAARGATILAQPAANPWPWDGPWVFADPGEHLLRSEQWVREGLATQLASLDGVRFAVNPHLIGHLLDQRFDGESTILARRPDGTVEVLARARATACAPASEEVIHATVSLDP